jgi:hypothetical protein
VSFEVLVRQFTQDLERCGAVVLHEPLSDKPARIRVMANDRVTDCLLFIWNITPGGGDSTVRPANERRIQEIRWEAPGSVESEILAVETKVEPDEGIFANCPDE